MQPNTHLQAQDVSSAVYNDTTQWGKRTDLQSSLAQILWRYILQYMRRAKKIVVNPMHSDCVTMFHVCTVRSGFTKLGVMPGGGVSPGSGPLVGGAMASVSVVCVCGLLACVEFVCCLCVGPREPLPDYKKFAQIFKMIKRPKLMMRGKEECMCLTGLLAPRVRRDVCEPTENPPFLCRECSMTLQRCLGSIRWDLHCLK